MLRTQFRNKRSDSRECRILRNYPPWLPFCEFVKIFSYRFCDHRRSRSFGISAKAFGKLSAPVIKDRHSVPYPMGFFPKNVDGRIDDATAGWKGTGLWSTYGTRAMFHLEGGTANRPRAVRLELRPDPLPH